MIRGLLQSRLRVTPALHARSAVQVLRAQLGDPERSEWGSNHGSEKGSRLFRRRVYPELAEGLLAMTGVVLAFVNGLCKSPDE